jgi:hypothetical protein
LHQALLQGTIGYELHIQVLFPALIDSPSVRAVRSQPLIQHGIHVSAKSLEFQRFCDQPVNLLIGVQKVSHE